mgnify:CR=1 FL=1
MRILSQDGLIFNDIPYEKFVFGIARDRGTDKFCIVANKESTVSESGFPLNGIMAEYSTEAKARKAMEMLHEAYCGVAYMKHADYEIADIDLSQEIEKKIREEMMKPHFLDVKINNPVIECKVFRFPSDDEMEV